MPHDEDHAHAEHEHPEIETPDHALHVPLKSSGGALVLCHGAKNTYQLPLIAQTASHAAEAGLYALRFNFTFVGQGLVPTRATLPQAVTDLADAIAYLRHQLGTRRLFMAGKSFGGWPIIESVCAGQRTAGLVFWGLPIDAQDAEAVGRLRLALEHVPALFIHGSADTVAPPDAVRAATAGLSQVEICIIEGGDHSYRPTAAGSASEASLMASAAQTAASWIITHDRQLAARARVNPARAE